MRMVVPKRWRLIFSFAIFCVFAVLAGSLVASPVLAQIPKTITAPRLMVPIPGLDFRDYPAYRSGNELTIPFLAAYVSAFYKYIVGVSLAAAAVMIVYGGFQYIVGSSMARIGAAKKIISDAVIGLILVLATYTILQTINPATLDPKGLKVKFIEPTPLQISYEQSLTTTALTGTTPDAPPNQNGLGAADVQVTECPFTLENPIDIHLSHSSDTLKDPRNAEFLSKIKPLIAGKPFSEAFQIIGGASVACKVTFSSCGYSALVVTGLASKEFAPCLTGTVCNPAFFVKHTKSIFGITGAALQLRNTHCWGATESCGGPPKEGCTPPRELLPKIRNSFPSMVGNGYPDNVLKELQPGDWLYVYSGNDSCSGEHSILFNGWADESKGLARTVQGPGLDKKKNPPEWRLMAARDVCLSQKCGSYLPITLIIRPNP